MISHSCSSTATWHYGEDDAFILRARQYIAQGDEITISYIGDDDLYKATHSQRKLFLYVLSFFKKTSLCSTPRKIIWLAFHLSMRPVYGSL
jgi:hypothetical protein